MEVDSSVHIVDLTSMNRFVIAHKINGAMTGTNAAEVHTCGFVGEKVNLLLRPMIINIHM